MAEAELLGDVFEFVKHCKSKFNWSDLKDEVIMNVGCGNSMNCEKALLEQYPDIREIIAIDKDPDVIENCRKNPIRRIELTVADIEERDSILPYIGKMNKVISTSVFHLLSDIETAFQNVFDLLQPGGEAALQFFTRCSMREWFKEMLTNTQWRDVYQNCFNPDVPLIGKSTERYVEMVRNVGFEVIECIPKEADITHETDESCLNMVCHSLRIAFAVPPEMEEEFKKDTLEVYEKVSGRDADGRLLYRASSLTLLLSKPKEGSRS